jgi:hypothetical protein
MEPNDPQYGNTPHNQRKLMEDYAINALLAHLSQLFLVPLPKSQEVRAFLPLSYLPLRAQRLITASASAIGVSCEMTLACLLGSIFAAARGNFQIQVSEHHREVVTAYIVASADSGQRKSAAVDIYRSPLAECQAKLQEQHATMGILGEQKILQAASKKAEEDIARRLQRLAMKTGCVDMAMAGLQNEFAMTERLRVLARRQSASPRFLADMPTPEALACELAQQDEALAIHEAEGGLWKHRTRAKTDDIFLKAFTGEAFASDTKTQGSVYLQAPVLSICTLVQPNVLDMVYGDTDLVEHGLVPRILPILVPSRVPDPYPYPAAVPDDLMAWFRGHIRALLAIKRPAGHDGERTFHTLILTPDAKAEFDAYSRDINTQIAAGGFDHYRAFGSKLAGHAIRLAGAAHLLKHEVPHGHPIDRDSMICGMALADFFRQHAAVAFDPTARRGIVLARKILSWIQRERRIEFKDREAQRGAYSGRGKVEEVRAGLDVLERHNLIRRGIRNGGPTNVVHPHAYGFIT